ncbi:UNVERIFIED_CONTAM: hypothetical protein HHA_256910 [Hammondia hammondi]|eukprot:XP_008883278.1 hypothetical protein HHA_256910 [Hammondia hammondi]
MRTIPLKLPQWGEAELLGLLEQHCREHYGHHQLDLVRPILQKWHRLRKEISRVSPRAGSTQLLDLHRAYLTLCCLLERHFSVSSPPHKCAASLSSLASLWTSSLACGPPRSSSSSSVSSSASSSLSRGVFSPQKEEKAGGRRASAYSRFVGGSSGRSALHADFWAFEKACAIFNCAACEANAGLFVNREKLEDFQEALERFRRAGGIFELLRDTLPSMFACEPFRQREPSSAAPHPAAEVTAAATCPEFSVHALTAYSFMMRAQAQCVSYERALREKLGKRLLSMLAAQVATFYASALSHLLRVDEMTNATSQPGLLLQSTPVSAPTGGDAGGPRPQTEAGVLAMWLKSQELSYLAAAHFQLARYEQEKVEMEGEGYGRLVARLRLCREFLVQAAELVEAHSLKCNLSGLFAHIVHTHEQLERDNAVVYLEAVPDQSRLTPLEHACCVELSSVAIQDLQEPDANAAAQLCQLLPTSVRVKGEEYATRYRVGVRDVKQRVSEELSGVSSFLLAHQLPDQLREVALKIQEEKKGRNQPRDDMTLEVPSHLWNQIRAVQAAGGFDAYEEQQTLLAQASVGTQRQLADIEHLLEGEEAADEAFREESCGPSSDKKKGTRTPDARGNCSESDLESGEQLSDEESLMLLVPAAELASQFRISLDKYRSKAEQAQSANLSLEAKLREAMLPVPLSSSFCSPPSRASSPSSTVDSPPASTHVPRTSGGSALCMHATLKAASPSEFLSCLLPRLEACMQSRQTETERTQRAAERSARIREREEKLHATHQALANLEAAVHALQSEAEMVQENVDLDAVHSLLLRARNEGELFDSVLLREEQATLGPVQERIATACRRVRAHLEAATTTWETFSVSERSWFLFTREEKARASEALRTEANVVFSSLSMRLKGFMEMQEEQEEGAAFFCQLQQFLSEIRRQVETWRESREAARQRVKERRRLRETAETSRRSEGNWEEETAKATAESCPQRGQEQRPRRDGDQETRSTEAIRHNPRRGETDPHVGEEGGRGERRGLSAASSPHFPKCDAAYSPTKTGGAGGAHEGPRPCSPQQRVCEAPGDERLVRRFPETNGSEGQLSACGANEEGTDAAEDLRRSAHAFSVFLPPGASLRGEAAWAEPCFPERATGTNAGGDERENEDNRVFAPAANGVVHWTDEREKRHAAEKAAKVHTGYLDKGRDASQDDVDMDATTAAGLAFEDEGEHERD